MKTEIVQPYLSVCQRQLLLFVQFPVFPSSGSFVSKRVDTVSWKHICFCVTGSLCSADTPGAPSSKTVFLLFLENRNLDLKILVQTVAT